MHTGENVYDLASIGAKDPDSPLASKYITYAVVGPLQFSVLLMVCEHVHFLEPVQARQMNLPEIDVTLAIILDFG